MKKFSKIVVAASVCILAAGMAMAGEAKKSEISAKALWVGHLDVAAMTKSKLWEKVGVTTWPEKEQKQWAAFVAMIGMDPIKDISGITVYSDSFAEERGAAIVHGSIPVSHLETLLGGAEGHETKAYAGCTLHKWNDVKKGGRSAACFYDAQTVVMGKDYTDLERAIDVLAGRKPSLAAGGRLTIPGFAGGTYVWLHGADTNGLMTATADNAILQKAREITLSAGEMNGNTIMSATVRTDNAADASIIEMAVRGLVAFATLAGEKNPEMAKLATKLNVTTADCTVSLSLTLGVDEIVKAIEEAKAKNAAVEQVEPEPAQ